MRGRRVILLTVVLGCAWVAPTRNADARPVHLSKRFETDKRVGIGVLAGVPTGITGKFFFNSEFALDLGVGAYVEYRERDGLHLHMDFLWHPFVAVEGETFLAPMYVGVGARLLQYDEMDAMDEKVTVTHMGVRVPVGIAFDLGERPFDIFLEAAFVFDPVMSDEAEGAFDFNGGAGARFYF